MSYPELDALEAQGKELVALVGELEPDDFARPTRCEGWNVMDVVAHVVASADRIGELLEIDAAGREANTDRTRWWRMPDRTDPKVIADGAKQVAATISAEEAPSRIEDAVSEFLTRFRKVDPDTVIGNEWRTLTARELAANRCLELGVHSMDIGHATLRGERIHPDAAAIVADILRSLLEDPLPVGMGWDPRTFILTGMGRRELLSNERFVLGPLAVRFPLVR